MLLTVLQFFFDSMDQIGLFLLLSSYTLSHFKQGDNAVYPNISGSKKPTTMPFLLTGLMVNALEHEFSINSAMHK